MSFFRVLVVLMAVLPVASLGLAVSALPQSVQYEGAWGADIYHEFGRSVAGGCDLDGDGVSDLIVGAPKQDLPSTGANTGRVTVFSGYDGTVICMLDGEASGDLFGFSVSCGGNLNNDGPPDFLVGAPGHNSGTGKAYVYSGETFTLLHTFSGGATGDRFGFSVSAAGDVDNNGVDDLIVGAPGGDYAGKTDCGRIYVYEGASWDPYCDDQGEESYDSLGYSVSGAGDVNDDGHDDFVVGAPYYDGVLKTDNGRAYVLSGDDCQLLCWDYGRESNALFGWSVSDAGYFNADDSADFVIGAPGYDNDRGAAYVYRYKLIAVGQCTTLCGLNGAAVGDQFGWSVSGAGDVDNNGRDDVIIGAPGANNDQGKAYVYLGPGCSAHCVILGRNESDRFGFSVSEAGDVAQGDNRDDVTVGAPLADCSPPPTTCSSGKAYVHSGEEGCSEIYEFYPVYPIIDITSPVVDDSLAAGSLYSITWDTAYVDFFPCVKMRYSCNGGASWSDWVLDIPNNGSYDWRVPPCHSDNCLITICTCDECSGACDTAGPFRIIQQVPILTNLGVLFLFVLLAASAVWLMKRRRQIQTQRID